MNTDNQAQAEQNQATKLNVDFSHRLQSEHALNGEVVNTVHLPDTVDNMAYRALNILAMVANQFVLQDDEERLPDEVMYWTIDAAIKEIKDIQSIVTAHHYAEHA